MEGFPSGIFSICASMDYIISSTLNCRVLQSCALTSLSVLMTDFGDIITCHMGSHKMTGSDRALYTVAAQMGNMATITDVICTSQPCTGHTQTQLTNQRGLKFIQIVTIAIYIQSIATEFNYSINACTSPVGILRPTQPMYIIIIIMPKYAHSILLHKPRLHVYQVFSIISGPCILYTIEKMYICRHN